MDLARSGALLTQKLLILLVELLKLVFGLRILKSQIHCPGLLILNLVGLGRVVLVDDLALLLKQGLVIRFQGIEFLFRVVRLILVVGDHVASIGRNDVCQLLFAERDDLLLLVDLRLKLGELGLQKSGLLVLTLHLAVLLGVQLLGTGLHLGLDRRYLSLLLLDALAKSAELRGLIFLGLLAGCSKLCVDFSDLCADLLDVDGLSAWERGRVDRTGFLPWGWRSHGNGLGGRLAFAFNHRWNGFGLMGLKNEISGTAAEHDP